MTTGEDWLDKYRGTVRNCRQCGRAFHLRETVLVQIGNDLEVFCNNATDQSCSGQYFSMRGREPNCISMSYAGRIINGVLSNELLPEYRGSVRRCVECGGKFKRGDVVYVCGEQIVLCGGLGSGCATAYRRRHRGRLIPQGRAMFFAGPSIASRAQGARRRAGEFFRNLSPNQAGLVIIAFVVAVFILIWLFAKR